MRFLKIILLAIFVVIVIVLFIQNQEVFTKTFELKLDLKFYRIGPYLTTNIAIILVTFVIGVLFAVVWGAFYSVSLKSRLKEQQKRIKELEAQHQENRSSLFGGSTISGSSSDSIAAESHN